MWRKDAFAGGFSFALGAAILAVLLYGGWQVLQAAVGIATPFVGGIVIAVLLDPIVDRIQRQWSNGRRLPAVVLVFTAFLAVFVGLVAFVVPNLITQTQALVTWFTPMTYTVQRAPSEDGPYTTLTTGLVTTTYVARNLNNGTPYYFKVISTDNSGRDRRIGSGPVRAVPGGDVPVESDRNDRGETAPSSGATPEPSSSGAPGSHSSSLFSGLLHRRPASPEAPSTPAAQPVVPSPARADSPSPAATESPAASPEPRASDADGSAASDRSAAGSVTPVTPTPADTVGPSGSPDVDRAPEVTPPSTDSGRDGAAAVVATPSAVAATTSPTPEPSASGLRTRTDADAPDNDHPSGASGNAPSNRASVTAPPMSSGTHTAATTRVQSAVKVNRSANGAPAAVRQVRTTTVTRRTSTSTSSSEAHPAVGGTASSGISGGTLVLATPADGSVMLHWRAPTQDVQGIDRVRVQVDQWLAAHRKIGPFTLPASFEAVTAQYSDQVTQALKVSASRVGDIILASVSRLISIILIPIVTFYVLADIDRLRGRLLFLLPEGMRGVVQTSAMDIGAVFGGYVRGMLTVSLSYGLVTMAVFALPLKSYALLLGFAAGVLYIVPYLGPLVTALLAVILSLITGHGMGATLIFLALVLAQNQIFDNVVVPRVVGKSVGLHPLLTLFALLLGGTLFGLWGMLLSVPVAASIQVILFRVYPKLAAPTPISLLMDTEPKPGPAEPESPSTTAS